jgi:hypothetical protein
MDPLKLKYLRVLFAKNSSYYVVGLHICCGPKKFSKVGMQPKFELFLPKEGIWRLKKWQKLRFKKKFKYLTIRKTCFAIPMTSEPPPSPDWPL